ncbi:MAG: DUF2867 domain-containing protein [Candidatus Krumholzibacteria bacterium]|nr:DUF2867 domain-containing protein [Candidatus Krumholzibacteria bacterium]
MRTIFKIVVGAAIVVVVVGACGLVVMSYLARLDNVYEVPVPPGSLIAPTAASADYSDAWRGELRGSYRDIEHVIENAFHKPVELQRDDREVLYEGAAPGLRYRISYILDRDSRPQAIVACTTVKILNRSGRIYWTLIRPVHRALIPYMLKRMANAAEI